MVVDDDQYLLSAIGQTLYLNGYTTKLFNSPVKALEDLRTTPCIAVVSDIRMPGIDGMQLLARVMEMDKDLPVIMLTGHGDISLAVKAIHAGAYEFLEKPVDDEVLLASLQRAAEKRTLILENRKLHEELVKKSTQSFFRGMVGSHPLMHRLYEVVELIARESDPVILSGETGTGKELVAQAIHEIATPTGPFVAVNMAALPAEMIESELFGHEKGAFTGATSRIIGKFEHAAGGTLFLDEICSLPLILQAKLLRVLEERSFRRLGSNVSVPLKARVLSATNRNLEEEIAAGRFRQDLYYRLHVLSIDIPPLRKRKEDIPLLAEYFRQEYCRERQVFVPHFSARQLEKIAAESWPGNIRELRNYIRRLCVFGGGDDHDDVPEVKPAEIPPVGDDSAVPLKNYMDKVEKEYIVNILTRCGGKVSLAHAILGLSRKGLYDKINKYSIELDTLC